MLILAKESLPGTEETLYFWPLLVILEGNLFYEKESHLLYLKRADFKPVH